ncbi:MAG: NADH-quinone oxidoreductase subunit NuoE [Gammaproteobacteria bacterium]
MGSKRMSVEQARALLGDKVCAEIDHWISIFPAGKTRSASIAALRSAQHENGGYITLEQLDAVAACLDLPQIAIYEVASFYSMLETDPVGRHSVSVCTNVSCMLCGGEEILAHVERKLGVRAGESTPDGRIYLKCEEECLAACKDAPMMMVDHVFHANLTPERVDEILDGLE